MEPDDIGSRDRLCRRRRRRRAVGMRTVQLMPERASGDGPGLRQRDLKPRQGLRSEQLEFALREGRTDYRIGNQLKREWEARREHGGADREKVGARARAERTARTLDGLRHLLCSASAGAFGEETGHHVGQTLFPLWVVAIAAREGQRDRNDRLLPALDDKDPQSIGKHALLKRRKWRGRNR